MARMGRPLKEISKTDFEKLCGLLCTEEDIANYFECSVDTIERWCKREYKETFADAYKRFSVRGKVSIRRNQMALSKRNAAMAIWLGKQYLGQRDEQSIEISSGYDDSVKEMDEFFAEHRRSKVAVSK